MKKLIILFLLFTGSKVYSQTDTTQDKISQFVSHWIGKPYKFGGSSEKGIDCSSLVQKFYKSVFNIEIPRTCVQQYLFFEKVAKEELQIGDVIYFTSKVSPSGWHAGIYIGNNQFFHAANFRDKVKISNLSEEKYVKIFKSGGRIKNNSL